MPALHASALRAPARASSGPPSHPRPSSPPLFGTLSLRPRFRRSGSPRPRVGSTLEAMIEGLVTTIEQRFAELERQMADPEVIADRRRAAEVGREYRQLKVASGLAAEWRRARSDEEGARELLDEGEEMREELEASRAERERLEEELRLAMVERDPADDKDVIVEIQGGAGGEEAGLWAGDLYRMLSRYAERRGFKAEALELGDGKYSFAIKGDGAYSIFKFEGGTHRVQRVPVTESQGRIHT